MININTSFIPRSREEMELQFSAEMTQYQFEALECKLNESKIISQLNSLDYINNLRLSQTCDYIDVEKWLKNSWNTERLLRFTCDSFSGNSLSFSIQWAFPQIYYSAFSSILAYYSVVGFPERSHSAVIRKFGMLINDGKYPVSISFRAYGGKNNIIFNDINLTPGHDSIRFIRSDTESINNQTCQFLRSTRKIDLDNKKFSVRIPKRNGKGYKKKYNQNDWEIVSSRLGYTNLLSLLYRKRLKSNYRDIDTFLSEHLDATTLFNSIIRVIGCLNLIHEVFVAKGIGPSRYNQIVNNINYDFVTNRFGVINSIIHE